jgi:hypothetical protein
MKRVILAGILGGIAMFIWSFIAHDVLPLGREGISQLPNESTVMAALQSGLGDNHGLYLFPFSDPNEKGSAAMKHMEEMLAQNPSGMLVYHPAGRKISLPRLLGVEFATECLEVLLVAFLLSQTILSGFGGKFGFFLVAGVLASIATNVSYWNWYGFPKHYVGSYMLMQVVGFVVAGLVAAPLVKTRSS